MIKLSPAQHLILAEAGEAPFIPHAYELVPARILVARGMLRRDGIYVEITKPRARGAGAAAGGAERGGGAAGDRWGTGMTGPGFAAITFPAHGEPKPWCAQCRRYVYGFSVTEEPDGTVKLEARCHGESETVRCTPAEAASIRLGEAFR